MGVALRETPTRKFFGSECTPSAYFYNNHERIYCEYILLVFRTLLKHNNLPLYEKSNKK